MNLLVIIPGKCGGLGYINLPMSRWNSEHPLSTTTRTYTLYHYNFESSTWLAIADLLATAVELAPATVDRAAPARVAV
jgi:hypothetical protein